MMLEQLRGRFGDHDVVARFEGELGDRVVRRIGGEDWSEAFRREEKRVEERETY